MNPLVSEDDDDPKSRRNEEAKPTAVVVHHSSKQHCRRRRKSSRSRITIEDLTDSLLVEILVRLPVKSVHRSRSVSKRWRTLTSNPWFVRTFARHQFASMSPPPSPSPSRFQFPFTLVNQYPGSQYKEENLLASSPNMFGKRGYSLKFLPFSEGDGGSPTVVAASNDLLLCEPLWSGAYYICNPFTKHWIKLPPTPPLRDGQHEHGDSITVIGFVCHSYYNLDVDDVGGENEYRVIDTPYRYRVVRARFPVLSPFHSLRMEIFSSETCEWSELDVLCPRLLQFHNHLAGGGYFSNGRFHWMCETETEGKCVFAYDPFDNDVMMIDLPADLVRVEGVKLGVCRGRLRVLIISTLYDSILLPGSSLLRVWELEDYKAGKWQKVHDLHVEPMNSNSYWEFLPSFMGNISFHPYDGDIVFRRILSHFWACNMHYRKFKLVINPDEDECGPSSNKIFSLVQPWWPTPVSTLLPLR